MSWSVEVKHAGNLIDEPISSICQSPGSLICCVQFLGYERLVDLDKDTAIKALQALIIEIHKGNEGVFSNTLCREFDEKWSSGWETREEFGKLAPMMGQIEPVKRSKALGFHDYESFCGWRWRQETMKSALRFYFYYTSGYEVTYTW